MKFKKEKKKNYNNGTPLTQDIGATIRIGHEIHCLTYA